ncbi:MAG: hypothetical protein AB7O97_13355 [Planctomycetota bacterium]
MDTAPAEQRSAPLAAAPAGETAVRTGARTGARAVVRAEPLFPLAVCVVDGRALGADAEDFRAGGHAFRTCSSGCRAQVEADPFAFAPKVDAALIAAQLPHYPLTTCPVSGKPLDTHGGPVDLVLDGTLVRFCCRHCTKLGADPRALVDLVRATAHNQQLLDYPLDTCIVSGRPLGENQVTVMYGTTMVKFCCQGCADRFAETPHRWLPRLQAGTANEWIQVDAPARTTCIVTGKPLGDGAVTFTVKDRTWSTCCEKCKIRVEGNPLGYIEKLEQELRTAGAADYPLDTCPISGETLGSMGAPVELVLDGTLVRLCCDKCAARAKAKTADVVRAVRTAALRRQLADYPLGTCAVSGEPLGEDTVTAMVGTTVVRLCSERCVETLQQRPAAALQQVQAARAAARAEAGASCCKPAGSCCCGGDAR